MPPVTPTFKPVDVPVLCLECLHRTRLRPAELEATPCPRCARYNELVPVR